MQRLIKKFIEGETVAGFSLLFATAIALAWANLPFSDTYHQVFNPVVRLGINDGLMALFFLLIGLEIKRELLVGELSTRTKALQPLFGALGGIIVPALIFLGISWQDPAVRAGWAIPAATDIAFALGVLSLLGKRIPSAMKILLTAIAIIDDLAAILIIALFYSTTLHAAFLGLAACGAVGLWALNKKDVSRFWPYALMGIVVWVGFFKGGIHPTLAGVLTGLAVPLGGKNRLLERVEQALHPFIAFGVIPLFALANAGLTLTGITGDVVTAPLTLGIVGGLLIGKPIGIMGGLWLGHLSGLTRKNRRHGWGDYAAISVMCAIGFTMSLLIGDLAFDDPVYETQVRLGVLIASFVAALAGLSVCRYQFPKKPDHTKS